MIANVHAAVLVVDDVFGRLEAYSALLLCESAQLVIGSAPSWLGTAQFDGLKQWHPSCK